MSVESEPTIQSAKPPRALEPVVLILMIVLSVLGAIIGLNLVTTLGISANTSVIGALIAMLIGRLGLTAMRNLQRQNLAQSAISSATFSAANSILTPIAVPWAFGRPDLVWPLLIGCALGVIIDAWILYRAFGSTFLPADGAWPPGVAAAETIKAGDRGGRSAVMLGIGGLIGFGGAWAGFAMSAAGVALIGNMWALLMFGIGLLLNQYFPTLFAPMFNLAEGTTLGSLYIPHGVMIGAGIVALIQAAVILTRRGQTKTESQTLAAEPATAPEVAQVETEDPSLLPTVTSQRLRKTFGIGYLLYLGGAILLAITTGLLTDMSLPAVIGWVFFAAFAAIVHEVIVGLAAMHAGWFPAFAVTLIFLILGLLIGLPEVPMVVLVGYCSATGPAFADMGYDLKAGWILRREARPYTAYEMEGRRQQFIAALVGFTVAIAMVMLLWKGFFDRGALPPVAEVYATTITAGLSDPGITQTLLLAAIPGALIQAIGGPKRQMGVLAATGLLITVACAGWLVLAALAIRLVWKRMRPDTADREMSVIGAGIIAGDAVWGVGRIVPTIFR